VSTQAIDPSMIEALQSASSLQLYQLKAIIEGLLDDPRRGLAARASLHLGQAVRFVDFRDGQMRSGKIIAFKDTQATVLEQGTKRTWKIPCVSMQGYTEAERTTEQAAYEPPPEPVTAKTPAREFQRGDTVTFEDRDGRGITGVIVRVNQRTATIGTGTGGTWRVEATPGEGFSAKQIDVISRECDATLESVLSRSFAATVAAARDAQWLGGRP